MAYILVIQKPDLDFEWLNWVIAQSQNAYCRTRYKNWPLRNVVQIRQAVKSWPKGQFNGWLVYGNTQKEIEAVAGPVDDGSRLDFDAFCSRELANADWILFRYFTTFQTDYCLFATTNETLYKVICSLLDPSQLVEEYPNPTTQYKDLRNFSFSDDYEFGVIPLLTAAERDEPSPYLLCNLDTQIHSQEIEEHIGESPSVDWYLPYLEKLKFVSEIKFNQGPIKWHYALWRIKDIEAAVKLWSHADCYDNITQYMFSFDLNVAALEAQLNRPSYLAFKQAKGLSLWQYGLCNGGGLGECHAQFYSKNAHITHQIWQWVCASKKDGTVPISRY